LARDEGEGAVAHIEQGVRRSASGELLHRKAGAVRQIKYGAIDETNADSAARRRLDDVILAEGIADLDLNR